MLVDTYDYCHSKYHPLVFILLQDAGSLCGPNGGSTYAILLFLRSHRNSLCNAKNISWSSVSQSHVEQTKAVSDAPYFMLLLKETCLLIIIIISFKTIWTKTAAAFHP